MPCDRSVASMAFVHLTVLDVHCFSVAGGGINEAASLQSVPCTSHEEAR